MVAMLSDSRSNVATRSTVGKAEKSSGLAIHKATMRISTDSAMDSASPRSIRKAGIGRKKTTRMPTMPAANAMSRALPRGAFAVPIEAAAAMPPVPSPCRQDEG